ncbi:hypothetical protein O7600_24865 [Micromonospora sp. WMMA1998]|uniref:hypothetical protein n=1 Tax=Micromonospora sp. WMMA1998 TaxID=3015167 RepID=UPI00248BF8F5|nr:hypothetical protein [Micromonospora sp. WMMA1998]WBC14306.1 hypothetical protein O7600_24865 [Micromonospora sp. WMMA1998]
MVAQVEPADVGRPDGTRVRPPGPRPILWDSIALLALLCLLPILHDVRTMLIAPYWLDEAWVALSVRFPLHDLPVTTSSSPLGWSFLLRLVPDPDDLRLVTLVFQGLAVVAAYAFGRSMARPTPGRGVVAGAACAAVVLLLPAQQVRHDLKQYTADAAVTVGVLALVTWLEQRWSRRRLRVLTAVVAASMLFSHVTAIVAPCAFGGLLLVTAARRQWLRLVEVAVAGLNAGLILTAVYVGISMQGRNGPMQQFWAANFPRVTELPGYLGGQLDTLMPVVGAPGPVVVGLLVAGTLTLAKRDRPAAAIAVVLLPVVATIVGVAGIYPLLELRTSHFLLVTAAAVAGIGVAGLADVTADLACRGLPRVRPAVLAAAVCAVLLGGYAVGNSRWYRFDGNESGLYYTAISVTDVRSATEYVAAHRAPDDVVVMNNAAWYGFAFYSRQDTLRLVAPHGNTVGWWVEMPGRSDVVVVPGHDTTAVRASLQQAVETAARRGDGGRVWLIRSHVIGDEVDAWREALSAYRVDQVTDGVEPVVLISRE